jgi:hypothetical protein
MMTLRQLEDAIKRKENLIELLQVEICELTAKLKKSKDSDDEHHFRFPAPGDFWHDCYSPVLIVLESTDDGVVICDETMPVFEEPDQEMVLKSYQNFDDPEVKKYFSKTRKETGYTFDLDRARCVSKKEFDRMIKCYENPELQDKTTYRCIPGKAKEFVEIWTKIGKYNSRV